MRYEFILAEKLSSTTRGEFPELDEAVELPGQPGTVLFGPVIDGPHLHGFLDRFEDLGVTILEMRMLPD